MDGFHVTWVGFIASMLGLYAFFYLWNGLSPRIARWIHHGPLPMEERILSWLRRREYARVLNVDPDVIKARQKMDASVAADSPPQDSD